MLPWRAHGPSDGCVTGREVAAAPAWKQRAQSCTLTGPLNNKILRSVPFISSQPPINRRHLLFAWAHYRLVDHSVIKFWSYFSGQSGCSSAWPRRALLPANSIIQLDISLRAGHIPAAFAERRQFFFYFYFLHWLIIILWWSSRDTAIQTCWWWTDWKQVSWAERKKEKTNCVC